MSPDYFVSRSDLMEIFFLILWFAGLPFVKGTHLNLSCLHFYLLTFKVLNLKNTYDHFLFTYFNRRPSVLEVIPPVK